MTPRALTLCVLVIAVMAAASFWALGVVPEGARVAVHFGLDGAPDRFASAETAFAILPLAAAFAVALIALLPRFSPATRIPDASLAAYSITGVAVVLLLAVAHAMLIANAVGIEVSVVRWMTGALGLMLIVTGNYAGKILPNAIFGVRTPWTLADPNVWARTHRLYGWLWVFLGLTLVVAALAGVPSPLTGGAILGAVAALVLFPILYSLRTARQRPGGSH